MNLTLSDALQKLKTAHPEVQYVTRHSEGHDDVTLHLDTLIESEDATPGQAGPDEWKLKGKRVHRLATDEHPAIEFKATDYDPGL